MDSETKTEDPQTEHLWVLSSEASAGSDESREEEAGQYFGSQEKHRNRNEEASAEDAVIHAELGCGSIEGSVNFEKGASAHELGHSGTEIN